MRESDPLGLHRVLDEPRVLPQAAQRLDARRDLWPDEIRIRVQRLNLDAASFRQLAATCPDPAERRRAILGIVASRGKMQNPVTGSGGMLLGVVDEVGPRSGHGLRVGDQVATLVSLTLTPLVIEDGLARWDGLGPQVPCAGHAVLFGRSIAARIPQHLPAETSLAIFDVCGAPALTARVTRQQPAPVAAVIGAGGKSGSLSLAAARHAGARHTIGIVPETGEAALLADSGLADDVLVLDARDPVAVRDALARVAPGLADVTVVCADVAGCEGGAILATAPGGSVVFFSMATSFTAAALGAEGAAADVTMLIGNGFVPGHAAYAIELFTAEPGLRDLWERRATGAA